MVHNEMILTLQLAVEGDTADEIYRNASKTAEGIADTVEATIVGLRVNHYPSGSGEPVEVRPFAEKSCKGTSIMTLEQLEKAIADILPSAEVETDNEGQILIYTGLCKTEAGELFDFDE